MVVVVFDAAGRVRLPGIQPGRSVVFSAAGQRVMAAPAAPGTSASAVADRRGRITLPRGLRAVARDRRLLVVSLDDGRMMFLDLDQACELLLGWSA